MELCPITSDHVYYAQFEQLMESAFPVEERRSHENQRMVTDTNANFHPCALLQNKEFVGLITYWQGPGFVYVEHFATLPSLRGGGLGREALALLFSRVGCPVVLEVEPPLDDLKQRRIRFYERNGFQLWQNSSYLQPPYQKGLSPVRLLLMAYGALDEEADFACLRSWIHKEVYGFLSPLLDDSDLK